MTYNSPTTAPANRDEAELLQAAAEAGVNVQEIFDLLRGDMEAVEEQFRRGMDCGVPVVNEIGEHLRAGGGKRLRPAMLLLGAHMLGPVGESVARLGAIVEMIHTATLVHDDIIDEAEVRRGRPSANALWGSGKCVLAGDWLYMQAFKLSLRERNLRLLDLLIDLTQQMVEGELLQAELLGRMISQEEYSDLIHRKTACLFSTGMRLAAVLAGADEAKEKALANYGRCVGMAFQIVDDVLDLTASEATLGKPAASDLREGKATLPVLYALESCTDEERAIFQGVLDSRSLAATSHEQILAILHRHDAIDRALREASRFAEEAVNELECFDDSQYRTALAALPAYILGREK